MNTKSFIDKMPQIAHLGRDEQAIVLEKARYEAFVNMGLANKATLYLVLCIAGGFLIGITPSIFLIGTTPSIATGVNLIISSVLIAVGIGASLYIHHLLYKRLLRKGLEKVLNE